MTPCSLVEIYTEKISASIFRVAGKFILEQASLHAVRRYNSLPYLFSQLEEMSKGENIVK